MREIGREDARNADNKQIVKAVEIMFKGFVFIPKAMRGKCIKGLEKLLRLADWCTDLRRVRLQTRLLVSSPL